MISPKRPLTEPVACRARRISWPTINTIGHIEALDFIKQIELAHSHSAEILEELPAIVSRWLQQTTKEPAILPKGTGRKWKALLAARLAARDLPISSITKVNFSSPLEITFHNIPFPPIEKPKFSFIDLFAGIGGFRIALQDAGGVSLFSSELDLHAKETYFENFGEIPFGDISKFSDESATLRGLASAIPHHDILAGGFPCQPFSQAGLQRGFEDARGTLFFEILKIAKRLRPKVIFLENVKRLKTHDGGKTYALIENSLREIGYTVSSKILSAYDFGVPQNRERVFIVASRDKRPFVFPSPTRVNGEGAVGRILEQNVDDIYTISDRLLAGHKRRLEEHKRRGNGFGFSVFSESASKVNTISARYWKDGSEVLIEQKGRNPRMLTPRECARIQGFPDSFVIRQHRRHAYQQFGNSVAVPVIRSVASQIVEQYFS